MTLGRRGREWWPRRRGLRGVRQNFPWRTYGSLDHTQVDEASAKEERLHVGKKAKRSPAPCRDPERKRFRFNSESG